MCLLLLLPPHCTCPVPRALGDHASQDPPPAGFWETQVRGCSTDGGGSIVYGWVKLLAACGDLGWGLVTGSHLHCAQWGGVPLCGSTLCSLGGVLARPPARGSSSFFISKLHLSGSSLMLQHMPFHTLEVIS